MSSISSASPTDRAPFIVVEGTDGSGVSTQSALLAAALRKENRDVWATKQPTDGPIGSVIRLALAKRLVPTEGAAIPPAAQAEIMALYFAADRLDHYYNGILPRQRQGVAVVCDRYVLSSYAYQGREASDPNWVKVINSRVPAPDLTLFIDLEPTASLDRIRRRSWQFELFEEEATLRAVRSAYLEAIAAMRVAGHRIVIVDGSQAPEAVHAAVMAAVKAAFPA